MAWLLKALPPMPVYPGSNLVLVIFLTDEDRFEFVLHFVTAKAETSLSRLAAAQTAANRESEGAAANRPAGRLTAR